MDLTIDQLQKLIDYNFIEPEKSFISEQENPIHLEPFKVFGYQEKKNLERGYSQAESTNPYHREIKQMKKNYNQLRNKKIFQSSFLEIKNSNKFSFQDSNGFLIEQKPSQVFQDQKDIQLNKQYLIQLSQQKCSHIHIRKSKLQSSYENKSKPKPNQKLNYKSKTLKTLSQNIVKIIQNQQDISISQLIQKLLQNYKKNDKLNRKMTEEWNKKNLKRRLYDVINVLIAAKLIKKEKKNIRRLKNTVKYQKINSKVTQVKTSRKIQKQLQVCRARLQNKRQQLDKLNQRKQFLDKFFVDKINSDSKCRSFWLENKIKFPFVCVTANSHRIQQIENVERQKENSFWEKDNSSTRDFSGAENMALITFNSSYLFDGILLQGDIEVACQIGRLSIQIKAQKNRKRQNQIQA